MSQAFNTVELNNPNDFSFFAKIIGERLRNPNFQAVRRQTFLKSLLEQIKPICSFKTMEKIQKSINEIAQQKEADRRQAKQLQKIKNNKKQKNLVTVKETGRTNKFGVEDSDYDDDSYDEEDEEYYDEPQVR